ncbi:MAG: hypothetical protein RSH25_10415 [Bacteroides sp.]|uniref:hypothetical protein n=1 Tax=Bacteroides sp. TaxID=29523 RepID=UPI002FCB80EF
MKDCRKYILSTISLIALLATGVVVAYKLNTNMQKSKVSMNQNISNVLEEAITKNAQTRTKSIFIAGIEQRPSFIGKTEIRTFKSADTTFTYQYKIVDAPTALLQMQQCGLLLADSLKSEHIQQLFDSLLLSRNLKTKSIIRIVASGYLKKCALQTDDTASMAIHGRANYIMDNGLEKIEYIAYVHYPFATLWNSISKKEFYYGILLACVICFALLTYKIHQRIAARRLLAATPIMKISNNYQETEYPVIEDEYVRYNSRCVRFTRQPLQIIQLFLKAEQYRIKKNEIKELWPKSVNQLSNMTTAINRVNKLLAEIDCPYSIITDATDKEYYVLSKST